MKDYKKLMVVIDPTKDTQPALDRALELSQSTGAEVTAFLCIYDFSYDMTSMLSGEERDAMRDGVVADRHQWLSELVSKTNQDVEVKVVWHNRPYEAIITECIERGFDMIIKATHEHDMLKSIVFTPTDWHLLRKAPLPVLLVKEHDWPVNGTIVCAVNVSDDDVAHRTLNEAIIVTAQKLAREIKAQVHLVNGYPSTPVNIVIELPDFDAAAYNASIQQQHEQRIEELAAKFDIPMSHCHVKEGLAEEVIPAVAKELDAELVILGTVGRTGISAALIGNTAEHVIDSLDCDLLAIKPKDYVSPLQED
ncbi:universal stress protein UspE [Paraferrimonas sedimenticola]|uniref:Universal stress protein E n=1 Tax=Paraferrimonas sedimenticola TaxID=375674 RepID=A0AA37RW33_9GAMM|nr:universal stress protein UspE [Paraferrimonas sedimenticola]GLP96093.1 universal stress protein E [Paraferrimonas sedimenticola]